MEWADEVKEDFTEEGTFGLGFEVWVVVSSEEENEYVKQQELHTVVKWNKHGRSWVLPIVCAG